MTKQILLSLAAVSLLFSSVSDAAAPTLIGKDLSGSHPNFAANMEMIWNYTSMELVHLPATSQPPVIAIEPFVRSKQSPEWTQWQNDWIIHNASVWLEWVPVSVPHDQVTESWIREHIDEIQLIDPAIAASFRGLHYMNSNRLQINPDSTFLKYYMEDPSGTGKHDFVGLGYYTSAHEMLHHSLSLKGIPETLHHCMFVMQIEENQTSLMEKVADHLIENGIAGMAVKLFGLNGEVGFNPCSHLSEKDRNQAEQLLRGLSGSSQ
jgi:hypothetical protein